MCSEGAAELASTATFQQTSKTHAENFKAVAKEVHVTIRPLKVTKLSRPTSCLKKTLLRCE